MHFLLFALGIVFYSTSCDSHKLVCDGEPIDHHTYSFDHVRISFVNADSKDIDFDNLEDFNPSRKTVLIIHGLPICELSYRWAFELGKIWPKWVLQHSYKIYNNKLNSIFLHSFKLCDSNF